MSFATGVRIRRSAACCFARASALAAPEQLHHEERQMERRLELRLQAGERVDVQRLLRERRAESDPARREVAREREARGA